MTHSLINFLLTVIVAIIWWEGCKFLWRRMVYRQFILIKDDWRMTAEVPFYQHKEIAQLIEQGFVEGEDDE